MKRIIAFMMLLAVSTVTAWADPIPVQNHSFENAGLASGGWSDCIDVACGEDDPDWWINPDAAGASNTNTAFVEVIDGFAADGTHHVGIDTDTPNLEVAQNLGVAVSPNTTYTLTVAVGNRNADFSPIDAMSEIALYAGNNASAGGTLLGAATYAPGEMLAASEFADLTLTYDSPDTPPAGDLWVSLRNVGPAGRAHFDNVRVDAAPIPEPTGIVMVLIGLVGFVGRARRN